MRSGTDTDVVNANVAEYAALAQRHLRESAAWEAAPDTLLVETETSQSRIRIATAARTTATGETVRRREPLEYEPGRYAHFFDVQLSDGQSVVVT